MGATANFGFPYPDGGEFIEQSAVEGLASAVDNTLQNMEGTNNPAFITISPINNWSVVSMVRLYRMGRLVQMMGEVIYRPAGAVSGNPVPANRLQWMTIPAGWRPVTRMRTGSVRSPAYQTELYIDTDGKTWFRDPLVFLSTPGYSVHASWITAE